MPACRRRRGGRIGNGVQFPDRTAAVMLSVARHAIGRGPEKAAGREEAQSEDLPAERVLPLRPKERYVPVRRAAWAPSTRSDLLGAPWHCGICRHGPVVPDFYWTRAAVKRAAGRCAGERRASAKTRRSLEPAASPDLHADRESPELSEWTACRCRLVPGGGAEMVPGRRGSAVPEGQGMTAFPQAAAAASAPPGTGV